MDLAVIAITEGGAQLARRIGATLEECVVCLPERFRTDDGGWTWYTGAAGWMYRLTVETLLGLYLEVDRLRIAPCIPAHWPAYKVRYHYRETIYHLTIRNVGEPAAPGRRITLDGVVIEGAAIALVDDRRDHQVEMALG